MWNSADQNVCMQRLHITPDKVMAEKIHHTNRAGKIRPIGFLYEITDSHVP